ncbi:MAG TPA: hypothetical protein VFB59_02305 [Candidatus Saccharimonadales bacterium]|nr:hypothetical protein [Candidatus Saccharimonadales bacterium]
MKRTLLVLLVLVLGVAVINVAPRPFTGVAFAEGAQAFSISPPLIELSADPGQTVKASIKFTNVSDDELLIKTQINDFGAKNETGEPNIIFEDVQNTDYSLRQWVVSPSPFKMKPHESKTVDFPIQVPAGAEPGGHYAVIRFSGTSPALEESGVALTASIGSLVLLQVSGDITEGADMAEFYSATVTKQGLGGKQSMFEAGPFGFVQRIQNTGNVHLKPTGTIDISSMFGRHVATLRVNGDPTDPNNTPKSVLPGSIRRFEQTLDKGWMFGRYSATIKLSYGQGQKPLEQTISFWVIPYRLILVALIGVVALFLALRWAIKRYNSYIIRKSKGMRSGRR